MCRTMILLSFSLALAPAAQAAPVSAGRGAPGGFSRSAPGGFGRSAPGGFSRSMPGRDARPPAGRGGPGTLGGYLGRPPRPGHGRGDFYPGGFYPVPYYSPFYYDSFFGGPFGYDPFFPGAPGYHSNGYRSEDDWSKRGNVQLHVDPKDVEVIVDGIPTAKGGRAVLSLPTGLHHIEIQRSGYRTWSTDLDIRQGIRYMLEQRLERLPKDEPQEGDRRSNARQTGELRLDVQPPDTIVDLDGRFLGMANLLTDSKTIHHLPAGRHRLRFSRPGYQTVEREIDLSPDRPAEVSVSLSQK